jgi:pyruvate dehydrogenase E1 component
MYREQENIFYYITCMNENYAHPAMPDGAQQGIVNGMYRVRSADGDGLRVQLFGSGTILREALVAAEVLEQQFNVAADVWSVTSYSELRRDGIDCDRWNRRNPTAGDRTPYVGTCLEDIDGPFIAASDYMRIVPDQIRQWVPGRFVVLGTDGFGRSDSRAALREFFEVNSSNIVLAALKALADDGKLDRETVQTAVVALDIDPDKPNPVTV